MARSAVRDLTDPTNEARAYSMIGLSWGFGGIVRLPCLRVIFLTMKTFLDRAYVSEDCVCEVDY